MWENYNIKGLDYCIVNCNCVPRNQVVYLPFLCLCLSWHLENSRRTQKMENSIEVESFKCFWNSGTISCIILAHKRFIMDFGYAVLSCNLPKNESNTNLTWSTNWALFFFFFNKLIRASFRNTKQSFYMWLSTAWLAILKDHRLTGYRCSDV